MIRPAVGPLTKRALNETFGFAVGPWSIGARKSMTRREAGAGLGEEARLVGRPVVGQKAPSHDAALTKPGYRPTQEGGGGFLELVGKDLDVGQTRMVVDTDMGELPAAASLVASPHARDAIADAVDAPELLGVQVQEVSGRGMLVAVRRLLGIQIPNSG